MGGAILVGLIDSGRATAGVAVTNRTAAKAEAVRLPGVDSWALESDPGATATALRDARVVLIGVKPAMVPDLLRSIAGDLEPDAVVVSIAAGVTIATIEAIVSNPVVRTMPNTPSVVRRGVTGLAAGSRVTPDDLALVRDLFEAVGAVVELPEDQIDALGTISGSGPAYVYFLIEQLTATAQRMGFTEDQARLMVENTFRGASELLAASEVGPAELRRRVTSPNGTTMQAIAILESANLGTLFDQATSAALQRTKELAAGS